MRCGAYAKNSAKLFGKQHKGWRGVRKWGEGVSLYVRDIKNSLVEAPWTHIARKKYLKCPSPPPPLSPSTFTLQTPPPLPAQEPATRATRNAVPKCVQSLWLKFSTKSHLIWLCARTKKKRKEKGKRERDREREREGKENQQLKTRRKEPRKNSRKKRKEKRVIK